MFKYLFQFASQTRKPTTQRNLRRYDLREEFQFASQTRKPTTHFTSGDKIFDYVSIRISNAKTNYKEGKFSEWNTESFNSHLKRENQLQKSRSASMLVGGFQFASQTRKPTTKLLKNYIKKRNVSIRMSKSKTNYYLLKSGKTFKKSFNSHLKRENQLHVLFSVDNPNVIVSIRISNAKTNYEVRDAWLVFGEFQFASQTRKPTTRHPPGV